MSGLSQKPTKSMVVFITKNIGLILAMNLMAL